MCPIYAIFLVWFLGFLVYTLLAFQKSANNFFLIANIISEFAQCFKFAQAMLDLIKSLHNDEFERTIETLRQPNAGFANCLFEACTLLAKVHSQLEIPTAPLLTPGGTCTLQGSASAQEQDSWISRSVEAI